MSNLKTKNGITLIALVITIIVLLLLAGVTISTLTGDNGILTQAQTASTKMKDAETLENIRLAYLATEIDRYAGKDGQTVAQTLLKSLEDVYGAGNVVVEPNESGGWLITIAGKGNYEISASGEVSKKEGIALSESSLELQIIDGTPQEAVTLTTEIEGLENEEISWELLGSASDTSKITLTVAGDKKSATVQGTGVTTGEVKIKVNCGTENSAECTVTVVSVVHVSSISNITPTSVTVDRGTNTQEITATVNAGATERLIWTPSNNHIIISDPDVNETNNTQTVTIQVLSAAVSGEQITITAQNSAGNLTTNNTVTITVNVPVTGISITPTAAVTIEPSAYVDLTATVEPSDATNKTINWTIDSSSVSNVVSLPSTTSGTAIRVTGVNEGTATIKATSAANSSVTETKLVTVGEVSEFGDADETLKSHFGKTVLTNSDITFGTAGWQLFYADTDKIYLIYADYLENGKIPSGTNISTSGYCVYASGNRDNLINYLKTESNWTSVKSAFVNKYELNSSTTGVTAKGAPSVDMWMASYNAKNNTNLGAKNFKDLGTNGKKQTYYNSTSATSVGTSTTTTSVPGYLYTRSDVGDSSKWEVYLPDGFMKNTGGYPAETNGSNMYWPHTGSSAWNSCYGYWLARSFG